MKRFLTGLFAGVVAAVALLAHGDTFPYFPPPGITYSQANGQVNGAATGGAEGAGTINATGLFVNGVPVGTGSGSVSSVAFADGSVVPIYSISGSPITTSGTLTETLLNETAHQVFAGPSSGSPAQPTFRALVAGDLPSIPITGLGNIAADTILGNNTGSPGPVLALTQAQATALLNQFTTSLQGLVPGSGGGTTNFLRADGTWAAPAGSGGTVTSVGLADGSTSPIFTISGSPVTTSGTLTETLSAESAHTALMGPTSGGAVQPTFRALVAGDLPAGTGTVTSVAMTVPGILSVSGSPITTSGTLAVSLATENANLVFAGPTSGGAATPTFRALVAGDLPGGTGTVTSVAMSVPSWLSVSGSPITTSGTLAVTAAGSQTQNQVLATPNGSSGAVALRALVAADLPTIRYDISTYYPGLPGNTQTVLRFVAVRATTIPASATGSQCSAGTAATGSTTFTIYKNGVSAGTFNFGASATTCTFTVASQISLAAGDVLTEVGPSTADATLADIAVTLAATA